MLLVNGQMVFFKKAHQEMMGIQLVMGKEMQEYYIMDIGEIITNG